MDSQGCSPKQVDNQDYVKGLVAVQPAGDAFQSQSCGRTPWDASERCQQGCPTDHSFALLKNIYVAQTDYRACYPSGMNLGFSCWRSGRDAFVANARQL